MNPKVPIYNRQEISVMQIKISMPEGFKSEQANLQAHDLE
jgi:hypothetical protein